MNAILKNAIKRQDEPFRDQLLPFAAILATEKSPAAASEDNSCLGARVFDCPWTPFCTKIRGFPQYGRVRRQVQSTES
jgi:hypothetical protein